MFAGMTTKIRFLLFHNLILGLNNSLLGTADLALKNTGMILKCAGLANPSQIHFITGIGL